MVSTWATANHISLGQVVVDHKSNEITAIPKLLELLDVSGCLVTIDAMGCQTDIAGKTIEAQANYVRAVKSNQPTLHEGIMDFFVNHMADDFARVKDSRHETKEHGHGPAGAAVVLGVRCAGGPSRRPAVEGAQRDRGSPQRDGT